MNQANPLCRAKMNLETYDSSFPLGSSERRKLQQKLWGMYRRCYDSRTVGFKNWGGRGIRIELPWYDENTKTLFPKNFIKWAIEHGWTSGSTLQIDRIDNNGNYSPTNCRFVTCCENSRNRRNNRIVEANGERHTLVEWAEILHIPLSTLNDRWNCGWSDEDIINRELEKHNNPLTYKHQSLSVCEWSKKLGIKERSLRCRLESGWSIEKALTTPNGHGHNRIIEFNGEKKNIKQWAIDSGIPYRTFLARMNRNWKFEDILSTGLIQPKKILVGNKKLTVKEAALKLGHNPSSFRSRISRGWTDEKVVSTKKRVVNRLFEFNGHSKTLSDFARLYGLEYRTLAARIRRGWTIEKALTESVHK